MNWYLEVLRKYIVFSGRSRRREYWFFVLFSTLIMIALSLIDISMGTVSSESGSGLLSNIYALAVLLPSIAVLVRRLHDTNRSGWWILIIVIPLIGFIWLLVLTVLDSQPGDNRFGPYPKGVVSPGAVAT